MATFKDLIRQTLRDAEDDGMVYNGGFGVHNVPCIYWILDDYNIVAYLTDDETFNAEMLTEDMMDDLIFEER